MARNFDYKLIVIGSGAAGTAAALGAAKNAKKSDIAIVEASTWGGSAFALRDAPFAAASHFAEVFTSARDAARMGVSSNNLRFNYPAMSAWLNRTVHSLGGGSKKIFEEAGIDCYHGTARFLAPYEIAIGNKRLTAARFILATGARIDPTEITGATETNCLTPETALSLSRPPKALFIVGGGASGCELAQYFAELGTKIILCEAQSRLLPAEDPEVGQLLAAFFEKKLGIKVLTGSRVVAVEQDGPARRVVFRHGNRQRATRVETVILATGAKPILDYGLENARVGYNKNGIIVDRGLQTSSKHIWAAGDAIGGESSLKKATYEGNLAVANAMHHAKGLLNYSGLMRLTQTYPMIAKVGLNETECNLQHIKIRKILVPLARTPAAKINNFGVGFVKLLADRSNNIIGATVMAPQADLITQELALAIRHELNLATIEATPHTPFSWSEAIWEAAKQLNKSK